MKNKRIILINNGYPTDKNPQYTSYIKTIKEALEVSGQKVDLLVMFANFNSGKFSKLMAYIKYYLKLLFFNNFKNYDYVYINNYPHSFLPLAFKLPKMKNLIIHWHGTDIFSSTTHGKFLNLLSYKFIPEKTIHIAPSNYFAHMVSKALGIKKEKIIVSPSGGVDTNLFIPTYRKSELNQIVIGFASSLTKAKGMDLILSLLRNVNKLEKETTKKIKFVCINYGAEKNYYVSALKETGVNVEILPPMKKLKMPDFYVKLDLLLLTTRMAESLALVGIEAMSCGIPVIGTDAFAIKDYIRSEISGERFKLSDFNSFYVAVKKAIFNLEKYQPRAVVLEKYSHSFVIEQYREFFSNE